MKFEIKQAIVEFKSNDEFYELEESGKKPNIVRELTFDEVEQALKATHIRFVHEKGVMKFERKLTNVCVVNTVVNIIGVCRPLIELAESNKTLVIFSWEHPPTQTRGWKADLDRMCERG